MRAPSSTGSEQPTPSTPAVRRAIARLMRNVAKMFDAAVALALLDSSSGDLVTQWAEGFAPGVSRPARVAFGTGLEGWVAAHQEPILLDDAQGDARVARVDADPLRAILCAPLLKDDRLLGTLLVGSDRPAAFGEPQREAFRAIALIVAEIMGSMVAGEAMRARLRAQGVLLETARSLAGSLDGSQVLGATMSGLLRSTGCEAAMIYWLDARAGRLRPALDGGRSAGSGRSAPDGRTAATGSRFSSLVRTEVRLDEELSLAAWVARNRRARVVVPGDGDTAGLAEVRAAPESALLALPLLFRDRLRGVAVLARADPFAGEELTTALNLCSFAASALDNVERYQAAKAERAQLAAIFASASDGMAMVDTSLTIVEANPAFADLVGEVPQRLVGRSCCESLHRRETGKTGKTGKCALCDGPCLVARTLESGEATPHVECQFLAVRKDQSGGRSDSRGQDRIIDFNLTPLGGPEGRRVLLVGRDVTAARTMDQLQAQFLSMISHELRGPLAAINGYLDLVLSQDGLSDEQRGFLQRARGGSEHLKTLVDDLLLLSRRDAGKLTMNARETDLSGVVRESVEEMEVVAQSGEIKLELDVPRSLPLVTADKERMKQVLRNLISNAIKFTPAGGDVRVSAGAADGQLELRVSDTGIGIPAEHLEHIFERFYQVESTVAFGRFPGQGLGLAIVHIIVESHGGTIAVESTPNEGSTFTVRLPLAPDED